MLRALQVLQVMSEKMEPLPEVRRAGAYVSIRPHTSVYVSTRQHTSEMEPEVRRAGEPLRWGRRSICVLILLYMCPHTAIYVSACCYICVLILLYMCPHTAMYVSAYCYIFVLILLCMCPHTATYVSSYCYICVLILLYMCPHAAIYTGEGGLALHRRHRRMLKLDVC